ncbi:MAG: hypothetical protein GOV15_04400 [Candidatus Diapherotrites archaeon]|nr:hypothetical protein [Candidatus Diapherotrites archaeon]
MSYEASLSFKFEKSEEPSVFQKALLVELDNFNTSRSSIKLVSSSDDELVVSLKAVDLTAFRALVNSVFRVLSTVDSMLLIK